MKKLSFLPLLLGCGLLSYPVFADTVRINEVLASNGSDAQDEDGEHSDWIELHNYGSEAVDISYWGLSDDADEPFQWVFPAGTVLGPGSHFLVWASGNDRPGIAEVEPGIVREVFDEITGVDISLLTGDPRFPDDPDLVETRTGIFEAPVDIGSHYGQRMHGYLIAPVSGLYRFWVAADDRAELYLSTDSNPENAERIAFVDTEWTEPREWDKHEGQESDLIQLNAGQIYYISALMKTATGGDHLSVGWERPDEGLERPMALDFVRQRYLAPHTNFSVSASGETILLTRADGTPAHALEVPELPRDIAYGKVDGEGAADFYFNIPTPGSANDTPAYIGILDPPEFSQSAGFYMTGFDLELTHSDPEVEIIYTMDGSEPHVDRIGGETYNYKNQFPEKPGDPVGPLLERSMHSYLYDGLVSVEDRSSDPYALAGINSRYTTAPLVPDANPYKGTVVRARAHRPGYLPSQINTETYFISEEGVERFDLPVFSISTDESNLFDYSDGIYTAGKKFDQWRAENPEATQHSDANYQGRGDAWERLAHVEFFEADGSLGFTADMGLRIHGGASRSVARKSLRLYARGGYGMDALEYDVFPGLKTYDGTGRTVDGYRRLMLRNSGNDNWETLFRDAYHQSLASHLPIEAQAYRPAIHFINGEYWGITNIRERIDEDYIANHYAVDPDDVAILENNAVVEEGIAEDRDHFIAISDYAHAEDLTSPSHYQWIEERVDVDNLLLYFAYEIYIGNTDWPGNNIDIWRLRLDENNPGAGRGYDGRWRWIINDTDRGSSDFSNDTFTHTLDDWEGVYVVRLFNALLERPDFRNRFLNAIADLMNTSFRPEFAHAQVDTFNARLASSRPEHVARWTDGHKTGEDLKEFATQRPAVMRQLIQDRFSAGDARTITLVADHTRGQVRINQTLIGPETPGLTNPSVPYPWMGTYFSAVPVDLEAVPEPGHRFVGWTLTPEGESESVVYATEPSISYSLASDVIFEAVFEVIPPHELPTPIHVWDFEDTDVWLEPAFTRGGGTMTLTPGAETELEHDDNGGKGFADGHLRVNDPLGATLEFALPTSGFGSITLDYLTRRSGKGAGLQTLAYTVDGTTWTEVETAVVRDADPQAFSFDFSGISGVADNPHFAVRLTYAEGDGGTAGNNRYDDVTVGGTALPDRYPAWALEHFEASDAMDPLISGPEAEPIKDGMPNLLKYALGLSPFERVHPGSLTSGVTEGSHLYLRFHRDPEQADITYLVEASPDLIDWSDTIFDSDTFTGENSHGDLHEVSVPVQEDDESRRFLRLRVTRP